MIIGKLKKELNAWNYGIEVGRRIELYHFWPFIRVWCFRLNYFPPEGTIMEKWPSFSSYPMYQGFYWFWSPKIPIVTVKTIRIGRKYYSVPVKFTFTNEV